MPPDRLPRYPVYVPSKGRSETCVTAKFLIRDELPFFLVVEPQERDLYAAQFGEEHLLLLPQNNQGLIFSRNFIKDHATAAGHKRHWQLDDNIWRLFRRISGKKIPCHAGIALGVTEDFIDRYENVAIAGLNYDFFAPKNSHLPPFYLNVHVYSCSLILNSLPYGWRLRYNDDTDICLRVLSDGWCTVLMNAFLAKKQWTMTMGGGNTTDLYLGDGRLRMARSLERQWTGVVTTKRRFQRPQHVVKSAWKNFDTPLKRRTDIDWSTLPETDEHGMTLVQVKPEVKSAAVKALLETHGQKRSVDSGSSE